MVAFVPYYIKISLNQRHIPSILIIRANDQSNESSILHISIWWLVILSTGIRAVDCSCGYIFFQNRCIALTHVNISNVDIQFGTIGTQQETKHGAQESNGLEASCKAQNSWFAGTNTGLSNKTYVPILGNVSTG